MRVWRICREPFGSDALQGRGGLVASGRWHTRGRPIVYTSQSLALAALEVLVHVDRAITPADLVQLEIDVPDDLEVLQIHVKGLPKGWDSYPAPSRTQRVGDEWLSAETTPVLQVPSSLIPEEANYLLNPQHDDAHRFSLASVRPFRYDPRLTS